MESLGVTCWRFSENSPTARRPAAPGRHVQVRRGLTVLSRGVDCLKETAHVRARGRGPLYLDACTGGPALKGAEDMPFTLQRFPPLVEAGAYLRGDESLLLESVNLDGTVPPRLPYKGACRGVASIPLMNPTPSPSAVTHVLGQPLKLEA